MHRAALIVTHNPDQLGGASRHLHLRGGRLAPAERAAGLEDCAQRIAACWQAGDWVLVVGAGDVEDVGPMLKKKLAES